MTITKKATLLETSKLKMNLIDFIGSCPNLFLRYKIPIKRMTRFVTKNGYAHSPISKGLIPTTSSKPPNDRNKSAGKTTGIKLIRTSIRVVKKTIQLTRRFRCIFNVLVVKRNLLKYCNMPHR